MVNLPPPPTALTGDVIPLMDSFFRSGQLDKEAFRVYIRTQLLVLQQDLEQYLVHPSLRAHWQQLQNLVASQQDPTKVRGMERLQRLPHVLSFWLREAVESPQRFEFFVLSKATELSSGDQDKDYYHALMIRHDQLLAVMNVLQAAAVQIQWLSQVSPGDGVDSPALDYFGQQDLEERIYTQAQQCYEYRKLKGRF